ncbi:MAG: ComF family protein [Pseudomonadota bacterium]
MILTDISKKVVNILYPPSCGLCMAPTVEPHTICSDCTQDMYPLPRSKCKYCSYPFDLNVGEDMECARCLQDRPHYDRAVAPFYYQDKVKDIILKLKYANQTHLAYIAAKYMHQCLRKHNINDFDQIIPIPIHIKKHFTRKYNQAGLIANHLAKILRKPCLNNFLLKHKNVSQKGKSQSQRAENIKNTFILKSHKQLKRQKYLIVDDVMTTGATVNEAARCLKKAGAEKVYGVTLARVGLTHVGTVDF